jgi:cellulose synthase/poly-beta-1,6-N-acetylglucosamine synthase-like glycosyltransferase
MASPGPPPAVSVIIPAYRSEPTVAGCLAALAAQTFRSHEVLVVDSGPGEETERIVSEGFPWVRYRRSGGRLLPHAARNLGVELARAELLVFTDPDVYARPDWLARLVAGYQATGEVVVGAIECFGERWLDQGIHLCKFSKWLPAQRPRQVDMSPTANMLVSRRHFDAAGGLPGDQLLGDVSLSRRLVAGGRRLWLQPDAVVEHHHLQRLGSFLVERYRRGRLFGELRCATLPPGRGGPLAYLLATVLPIRLPRILALVAMHAARAGRVRQYLSTLPVVAAGHATSLAGEAAIYARRLVGAGRLPGVARMAGEPGDIQPP